MDTGGKIALGILVPLAVGGAAVAAYFLYNKKSTKQSISKRDAVEYTMRKGIETRMPLSSDNIPPRYREVLGNMDPGEYQDIREDLLPDVSLDYNMTKAEAKQAMKVVRGIGALLGGKRRTHRRRR